MIPTENAIHNAIANALSNGTTYSNVRQAAKDVLALIPTVAQTVVMDPQSKAICDSYAEENQRLSDEIDRVRTAAQAPNETLKEAISNGIMRVISNRDDLGYTHFIEIRDAVFDAISPVPSTEGK